MCLVHSGCAPPREPAAAGVLMVAEEQNASFVRNFNPLLYTGDVRWPARHAMYETLLIFNPVTSAYVPWLATDYSWSDDRKRLRLTLRHNVLWSDGRPFTARDVVFTFQLLAKHKALDVHGLWRHLATIEAIDDRTVELKMVRRHVPILEDIAEQPIVPAHVWSQVADPLTFTNETPVATGPFTRITTFKNQVYEVAANPLYWQPGVPKVKALRFRAYPSNEQTMLALMSGDIEWAGEFLPAIDRVFVGRNPAHHKYWSPLIDSTVFLYPNTQRKPFDDPRVRKAISHAIDRPLMVKVAMHGYTRPSDATGLNDAYTRFHDAAVAARDDWAAFDLRRAGELFDQAGMVRGPNGRRAGPDGAAFSAPIIVPAGYSDWVAAAQIIARGLQRIGIDSAVRTMDFEAWFDSLQKGNYSLSMGWTELSATPYELYHSLMSSETVHPLGEEAPENWHRFGSFEADQLLAGLEDTDDPAEWKRLTVGLEALFVQHAPAIPLFPGPLWGQFNDTRFTGFPEARDPYAALSPHLEPQSLLVLTRLAPR